MARSTFSESTISSGLITPGSSEDEKLINHATPTAGLEAHGYEAAIPQPGKTYKIHHHDTNELITLDEGQVKLALEESAEQVGGWLWVCEENMEGWLGFRNRVSGDYLGCDQKDHWFQRTVIVAHDRVHQSLCVRPDARGGNLILVKYHEGDELRKLSRSPDGKGLVGSRIIRDQWEFEEV